MNNVFFTADEHYGHANIIKYCNRPFSSPEEMTEELVQRHNAVVRDGDSVYHLGDMFWRTFGNRSVNEVMHRLTGQHYYIWGNHDELLKNQLPLQANFSWCKKRATIAIPNRKGIPKIVLDHYSGRVWEGSNKGYWLLYGHSHGALQPLGYSFDVGVDCWNYAPVSLEEVSAKMRTIGKEKEKEKTSARVA